MPWLFSWWRLALVFHYMSLCPVLLRLAARVSFSLIAIAYATLSLLGDHEYGLALKTLDLHHFQRAAQLFPLLRSHRSGLAYGFVMHEEPAGIPAVRGALRYDPNAADLWLGLARLELKAQDEQGYNVAVARLKELTPGLKYTLIQR
jgi:hypothetical protein